MADNDTVVNEVREEAPQAAQEDPTPITEVVQAESEQTDPVSDQIQEEGQ